MPVPVFSRLLSLFAPRLATSLAVAGLALMVGCTTPPEAPHPSDTTKYTLEDTDRFALIDGAAQYAVSCTGLMERPLADGRMEIVANLKNREAKRLALQSSCVFKDANGVTTEETPWQEVTLPENTTLAIRFTASTTNAKRYTIRVRDAR